MKDHEQNTLQQVNPAPSWGILSKAPMATTQPYFLSRLKKNCRCEDFYIYCCISDPLYREIK